MRLLRQIAQDTWKHMSEAQLLLVASALAYTTILSVVPVIAVGFSIFKAFGGLEKLYAALEPVILRNLAASASDEAIRALHDMIGNVHAGALGIGGLLSLLATSFTLLSNAERAINRVWKTEIKRSLFARAAAYWLFVTLGPLGAALAVGAAAGTSSLPLTSLLPSGTGTFVVAIGLFFCVYKWVPCRPVHWRPALVSALVTSCLWNLARIGYATYTAHAVGYGQIYGSLAAVPILLLWIYIGWLIVLTGAALGAALQRRLDL